ncbi:MAG: GGDEF domain-containing protein [Burkholderiales bacterium]
MQLLASTSDLMRCTMRNEKNSAIVNKRLDAIRRNAMLIGIPLCILLGIALACRLDMVINNTVVAAGMSFYLVASIGLLWGSDLRHQLTMRTIVQLESENERLCAKSAKFHLQANYDGLTSLPNIRLLPDRFMQAAIRAKRNRSQVALCLVTLDDFIPINERYGSQAATKVVTSIARRLRNVLRDSDSIVRISSSDFVVVAESIKDLADTQCLTEKLKRTLAKEIEVDNLTLVRPHAKLSCVTYPNDGDDLETLLKSARTALYGLDEPTRNIKPPRPAPAWHATAHCSPR